MPVERPGKPGITVPKKPVRTVLSRELILSAALDIVDSNQVRELSMTRLGKALGADPSAVYRHFRNKDELLLAMADAVLQEVVAGFSLVPDPIENLRGMLWALRTGHLRRPGLAQEVAARFTGGAAEAVLVREMIESIQALGFTREEAIRRTRALAEMTLGHVVMTADVLSLTPAQQAFDLQMATFYYLAPSHPVTALVGDEQLTASRVDSDAVFHTTIETFLVGLAAEAPGRPAPGNSARGDSRSVGA